MTKSVKLHPASGDRRSAADLAQRSVVRYGIWPIVCALAGLVAILAAAITPLLPVAEQTATVTWPQASAQGSVDVTAPLAAQTAASFELMADCGSLSGALTQADRDGGPVLLVGTMPGGAKRSEESGLFITATSDAIRVVSRGQEVTQLPRDDLAQCEQVQVISSRSGVTATVTGLDRTGHAEPDAQPQIAGLFTDLATVPAGMTAKIVVDNRFDSSPSALKLAVMIVGVVAAVVAIAGLAVLDVAGRYHRRVGRINLRRLLMPRAADSAVTAVLVLWHFLGAGSSDDGYVLGMARNSFDAGYVANHFRFYGIAEAPFDWYSSFLAQWSSISTVGLWMRLPALVAGLLSWCILSRILLPRLGPAIRRSQWATFTAAAVFVAFWMPLCSGLRSEALIVLGSLLTWWGVEQAIATRRMLPAAGATLATCLTLALAPHGVIAVAILLAGSRPMLRNLRRRAGDLDITVRSRRIPGSGLFALLNPIGAAVALVVIVVFRDQTLATIAEAVRVRYTVGPTLAWYQEFLRFYYLTMTTQDGSLVRRVPMLLLLAALFVTVAIMLRRRRIRGSDSGPVWRLVGAILLTVLLSSFTPTKWTIQFGMYAGLAAAMTAVATVAVAQSARRSQRNLAMYIAVLLFACAIAVAGSNAWGWAYDFGISWFDKAPSIAGTELSSIFLVLTVVALGAATWFHLRIDVEAERGRGQDQSPRASRAQTAIASSPMLVIALLVVLVELMLFARAAVVRSDTYTTFGANMSVLAGDPCAMADRVLVEADANSGMLRPVGSNDTSRALAGESSGFTSNGVAPDLTPEPTSLGAGTINASGNLTRPFSVSGGPPGTIGGIGPEGVNGSRAALPFGLDPAITPVLGSYGHDNGLAELTTEPYRLPERSASPLIVITAAGPVFSFDADGVASAGRSLEVEFGRTANGSFEQVGAPYVPIDAGPTRQNRPWRNLRIPMNAVPAEASAMRIVARDDNLAGDQWLAVTPPRAPQLRTLQEIVGSHVPVLLDLSVGSQFPCQRQMTVRNGVTEIPRWRIVPDQTTTNSKSKTWQSAVDGGLLTTADALTAPDTMASYLENDWYRDWGGLQRLTPLVPDARPGHVDSGTQRTWGWESPGAIRAVAQGD